MVGEMIASLLMLPFFFIIWIMLAGASEYGSFNTYHWSLFWIVFVLILVEVYSPKIRGHWGLRTFILFCCWFGISSFMMGVGIHHELLGCFSLICVAVGYDTGKYILGRFFRCFAHDDRSNICGELLGGVLLANFVFFLLKALVHPDQWNVIHKTVLFRQNDSFLKLQLLILAAIVGDLIKPWFMRRIGVKSFSWIIPGHPGLIDRLNSLMFMSVMWIFCR